MIINNKSFELGRQEATKELKEDNQTYVKGYKDGLKDKDKEMLDKIQLYFDSCMLNRKVPKLEELKERLSKLKEKKNDNNTH